MTKKVAITGGAGFIGSNLVKYGMEEKWEMTVVDDLSNGHLAFLPPGFSGFLPGDFADDRFLDRVRKGEFDVVIHLAACPRVSYSVEHPFETNDTNVTKTLLLMDACRKNKTPIVFASSCAVYGDGRTPTTETEPKNPLSPYALQKSIIEDYLALYAKLYGLRSVVLRFFNVFGPHQLGDSPYATAVSSWLTAIKKQMPLRSDGDGTQTRDMCYVENVVDAISLATGNFRAGESRVFNVGNGVSVSNNEIINALVGYYPDKILIKPAPPREGDVKHTLADITKAGTFLKYEPCVSFWDGLDKTINWVEDFPEFLTLGLKKL